MKQTTKNLTLSALFMALGFVLPFITGQIPQIGNMLLPMHLPVFLCGLICGWNYGAAVGFLLPILRSVTLGMPPLFPIALAMAFELMTYGLVVGLLYGICKKKNMFAIYRTLIAAMIAGRGIWGIVQMFLLGISGKGFTWQMFMAGAFLNAIPGIIIQLLLIPVIVAALNRTGLVEQQRSEQCCKI